MAVKLNTADLQFILRQIKIAEANSSGIPLIELRTGPDGSLLTDRSLYDATSGVWLGDPAAPKAISDPHLPYGLRTVDGSDNNLVPGRGTWGSAGQPMPQLLEPRFLDDDDGDEISFGPGQAPISGGNYGNPGNIVDSDPRTISNLIVDVTLNNPAAIAAALQLSGSTNVIADQQAITAAFEALKAARASDPDGTHAALENALDALVEAKGLVVTNGSINILNVAPDDGLSKPFNAWMTFFGQFFDHGLDLISKGGNGTVYVPLNADDPLIAGKDGALGTADDLPEHLRFMTLTRATPVDGSQRNVTTPFIDQNQTYTSNPSHQVFLREYVLVNGQPQATGRLLGGADDGLATWADVKNQAKTMLGIDLQDSDVGSVPMLLTDAYGAFVRGANGLPQVMVGISPTGEAVYATGSLELGQALKLSAIQLAVGTELVGVGGAINMIEAGETVGAARTLNAFLDDIAHTAVPVLAGGVLQKDLDDSAGNEVAVSSTGRNTEYDDELLDRHYATGDGRGNENIGLTAVHHLFHSEHNRQVAAHKMTILQSGDLAFVKEWVTSPMSQATLDAINSGLSAATNKAAFFALLEDDDIASGVAGVKLAWDGERLFQAGRFATEMQYQHLVFEEFARKVQPLIDPFVFNPVTDINPAIFAEFANTVYRFGHSMLTESMPRIGPDGKTVVHVDAEGNELTGELGLIEAFLNPIAFDNNGQLSPDESAAAIIRGMTIERGSEIDEFVVDALRNNLLGLPLDLPALNIARGRDTGTPSLNDARAQLYAATQSSFLTPYKSWVEMAGNLKNPMSIVNFIAAYGTHSTIEAATTLEAKRAAAMALVFGDDDSLDPNERLDFLNARGEWASKETGLNLVDLWVGGLAEKQMPFGGMLGSTFNAIFEAQLENLQDADRFYYLSRTQGQNFLNELEQNSFSKLMLANTTLADPGADGIRGTEDDIVTRHIGIDAFADYDYEFEVNVANQLDQNGAEGGKDPTGIDPLLEAMGLSKVQRDDPRTISIDESVADPTADQSGATGHYLKFTGGEHVLVGGTAGDDTIITDFGDDAVWGDAGDDRIESGAGVDLVNGGGGDDIITDSGDSGDFLKGEEGNDVIANSNGIDILMGGRGKDVIFVGVDDTEVFGGEGDDFILGGDGVNLLMGNEGNDWMEAGGAFDTTAGDNSELFFNSKVVGHDVMFAGNDEHDFDAESGDDIMVQGESVMRSEGMFGFDWAIFKGNARDAYADMRIPIFTTEEADILRNRFDKVEALSGWENDDTLIGDDRTSEALAGAEEPGAPTVGANENVFFGDGLDQAGIDRIDGLDEIVSVSGSGFFDAGNIILGGAGSDLLTGNGGDDILDGDRWLNVRIRITKADNPATGGVNEATVDSAENELTSVDSLKHIFTATQVSSEDLPSTWAGKSLFELMISREIRPEQMHIVREIKMSGPSNTDVDTAVFSNVQANYTLSRRADGSVVVTHSTLTNGLPDDGTDTLRNIEKLQFADGSVDVAMVLDQPFERLNITAPNGDVGTLEAVFTDLDATRPVTLQWQVLGANGSWRDVGAGDGAVAGARFTPTAALAGSEIRVVANWTGTLAGSGAQRTVSVETGIVGTAADEDLAGSTAPHVILGLAGDDDIEGDAANDVIDGGDGDDRLDGGDGDDTLRGNDGADVLVGRTGNNRLDGGADDDALSGGHGNDTIDGGTGTDTVAVSGPVEAYSFERSGAAIIVRDNLGLEGDGVDSLVNVELLQVGDIDVYTLGAAGTAAADIVVGTGGSTTLSGNAGNDRIFAGAGNDSIAHRSGDGRDFIDGGAGVDTFQFDGIAAAETFRVYTRLAWQQAGNSLLGLSEETEIVVTRNGTTDASVVAELAGIEEIHINAALVGAAGGAVGGDAVLVIGDFTPTSLLLNTITIDGAAGDDTIDISALGSAHRIVFRSHGGNDTIVGNLRPQDVVQLPAGQSLASFSLTSNPNGTNTFSNGSHSITFTGAVVPQFQETAPGQNGGADGGEDEGEGITGAFSYTALDIDGLEALVKGQRPAAAGDDDVPVGPRTLSGFGNNVDHPTWGSAEQPFLRLTEAHYGEADALGNRAINPLFEGLDAREISDILGVQEAGLPLAGNDANIFFMAMGQYIDHGLDFLPKGGNGTIAIGAPGGGGAPGTANPADLTRGTVLATDADGIPQHENQTSPFIDQNQAYGSNALVGQFLRESDGAQGHGMRLLAGVADPSNPDFKLLPTLRELIQHHWNANTIFTAPGLPGGSISFRDYYTNFTLAQGVTGTLFDSATGTYNQSVLDSVVSNFMGSGYPLLIDTNPFVNVLDHFVAGDGRVNENFALTSIHTIWARNHNFHVETLLASGFQGTAEEVFQAAKMVNEAEYQRVVFDEYLDTLIGGIRSPGTHGFEEYNPNVDSGISHEFAAAVFRFGHSLIGQTMEVRGADGSTTSVNLFDAFLNPSNAPGVFNGPLPPGYVPQPGYAQHGVGNIIAGTVGQPAEDVDFNIVDAVRNDLVRIRADLFAFNVARGWDVGLGTLNQVRMDLAKSTNPYIRDAVGFAGGDLSAYVSWEDFQTRNGLSDTVIAQFKEAYPDLVLSAADIADFRAINPDITIAMQADGTGIVKGIDRVDLWVGGLAEAHINEGIVGQTFWVVLNEQFDRLQDGDRFYYLSRFENFDFYENFIDGQQFADIIARNTGLENLPERVFETNEGVGAPAGGQDEDEDDDDDDDDDAGGGQGDGDEPVGSGDDDDDDDDNDGEGDGDEPVGSSDDDDEDDEDEDGEGDGEEPVGSGDDDDDDGDDEGSGDEDDDDEVDPGNGDGDDDGSDDEGDDDGDDDGGTVVVPPPVAVPAGQPLMGTASGDTLSTGDGDDAIMALDGDDIVISAGGADVVTAGAGGDLVKLGSGADVGFGGTGNDQIFGGEGADLLFGEAGDDTLFGEAGDDAIEGGSGSDDVFAGTGDDLVLATRTDGDDTYWGEAGTDTLDYSAISANITVELGSGALNRGSVTSAQSGEDVVYSFENFLGGSGADRIVANAHVNVMDGGAGNDTFVFQTADAADGDVITGFQPGDKIDLSPLNGGQPLSLITGSAFTATGQVMVTHETRADGDHTLVLGNLTPDAGSEFTIDIQGRHNLGVNDFQGVA